MSATEREQLWLAVVDEFIDEQQNVISCAFSAPVKRVSMQSSNAEAATAVLREFVLRYSGASCVTARVLVSPA